MALKVNLKDIGDQGQHFSYQRRQEKDLDLALNPLLDPKAAFKVEFTITPLGDVYMAQGFVETQKMEQCSLCGDDFSTPVKRRFSEYLVKEENRAAHGHAPHSGLDLDNTQEVTFFKSYEFDLADFIREQFAIAIPEYPKCVDVQACEARQVENIKYLDREEVARQGHPAFGVLQQLKKH